MFVEHRKFVARHEPSGASSRFCRLATRDARVVVLDGKCTPARRPRPNTARGLRTARSIRRGMEAMRPRAGRPCGLRAISIRWHTTTGGSRLLRRGVRSSGKGGKCWQAGSIVGAWREYRRRSEQRLRGKSTTDWGGGLQPSVPALAVGWAWAGRELGESTVEFRQIVLGVVRRHGSTSDSSGGMSWAQGQGELRVTCFHSPLVPFCSVLWKSRCPWPTARCSPTSPPTSCSGGTTAGEWL